MIETLCIAAEITAALLLFSLARPRNNRDEDRDLEKLLSETRDSLQHGEQAIQTLQFLSILTAVKSPEATETDADGNDVQSLSQQLGELFSAINPLLPSMPTDALTDLRERKAIETLIEIASHWQPWLEHPIQIAIIQPDGLSDIDSVHGPVAGERMVRATADFLKSEIGGRGLITRFGFQSFAIALIGYSTNEAIEFIERIRSKATGVTWNIDEAELHSTFSASLVAVVSFDSVDHWEMPEDGIANCVAYGGNRGYWHDFSDATWKPMSDEDVGTPTLDDNQQGALDEAREVAVQPSKGNASKPADNQSTSASLKASEATSVRSVANHEATASTSDEDNSVSTDDLAALFQAAKKATASPQESVAPKAPPASDDETAVSTDDIAALIQAAKSSAPATPKVAREEPPPANDDLNSKATSDDIAALFETVRDGVKPALLPPELNKTPNANLSHVEYDKPALKSPEEMGIAASEDDIADLFNAFKK